MTNQENTVGLLLLESKKQRQTIFGRIAETPVVGKKATHEHQSISIAL